MFLPYHIYHLNISNLFLFSTVLTRVISKISENYRLITVSAIISYSCSFAFSATEHVPTRACNIIIVMHIAYH